ncbi:hypothetical protein [Rhodococcus sp. NBC_00294]|uniref:hypothetical protein n=1 Tax=Rhodococcus sp. NBC_00294 TaxID=2976004 RepID=UPI002E2E73A9|nr:hypothetical protein [Rhodococcus sp. NBC_00294]
MTAMRTFVVPIAALCASALVGCSGGDSATDAPAAGTTVATSTVEPTTTTPAVESATPPAPGAQVSGESTATSPRRTPEEVSDLFPWNQPRPSPESGTVDPALFQTAPGLTNFTTPSGNVQCGIWAGGSPAGQVGCQAVTSVQPVDGPMCTNAPNDKYAVRVDDAGSHHLCTTQGIYTSPAPRVLEYGEVLSTSGVVCSSDVDFGVTCWGTAGAFMFARDWNETF